MEAKRAAALRCVVLRMREFGMRLPAATLMQREHPSGGLIAHTQYTYPKWHAELYEWPEMKVELIRLNDVVLTRENGGVRQFVGTEWHRDAAQHYPQTWLCTPTLEVGLSILEKMPR